MGRVARASRPVTIIECSSLTNDVRLDVKRCRTLSEASVVSLFTTKVIPAKEADTLGDRSVVTFLLEFTQKTCQNCGPDVGVREDVFS